MYVNRSTFVFKPACNPDDVRALIKDALRWKPAGMTRPVRLYAIQFGASNHFAVEAEFETLAECERLMAEWVAGFSPEFWKRWDEAIDQGGSNEVWTLIE